MSMEAAKWAYGLRDPELKHPRKAVLAALAFHANKAGECWPKQQTVADECGLNRTTVRRCIGWLADSGYIERKRQHRADGSRTNDRYTLDLGCSRHHRPDESLGCTESEPMVTRPTLVPSPAGTNNGDQPTTEPTTGGSSNGSVPKNLAGPADGNNNNGRGSTNVVGRVSAPPVPAASGENGSVEELPPSLLAVVDWLKSDLRADAVRAWKQQRPGDLSSDALGEVKRYGQLRVGHGIALPMKHGRAVDEAFA